jgi:pre-mRNA cleavage complex 2 protein Pcf11
LYLLDSISKNIGPPYITLFARIIERTFLTSYQAVDPTTKVKMEELLGTWRTGGSDGGELFKLPDEGRNGRVQHGIESQLFGLGGKGGGIGGGGRGVGDNQHFNTGVRLIPMRRFDAGTDEGFDEQMAQLPSVASAAERSGVLFDVRRLLSLRQDQAILHPDDAVNKVQIGALERVSLPHPVLPTLR